MPVERSAGAVIFRREGKKIIYLLLHYEEGHWDFPKGHIEKGEETEETVRREIEEEARISELTFIPGFKETIRYFFQHKGKRILKFVAYLLAETRQKEVTLSHEHVAHAWLPFGEAKGKITFSTSRKVLEKANHYLNASDLFCRS